MIRRVRPGDKVKVQPINKLVDAANLTDQSIGAIPATVQQSGTRIFVLNQTGRDMLHGEVAPYSIGDAQPYDNEQRMLQGTIAVLREPVAEADWSNWVVMAQRIPDGLSGWAYDSGVILTRVRSAPLTPDSNYLYCDLLLGTEGSSYPTDDWWHLKRAPMGAGRILWIGDEEEASGSGDDPFCWALVRFGGHDQYPVLYIVTGEAGTGDYLEAKRVDKDGEAFGFAEQFWVLPE